MASVGDRDRRRPARKGFPRTRGAWRSDHACWTQAPRLGNWGAGPRPHGSVTGPRPFGLQFGPRKTFGFREVFLTRASGGWCVLRPDQGYGQSGMSQSREQGRWRRGRDGPASGLRPQASASLPGRPRGPRACPSHPVIQSEGGSCKESGRWWQEGPRAGASFITCQCGLGIWLDVSELLGLAP